MVFSVGLPMSDVATLIVTFEPPDVQGDSVVTWALPGYAPVRQQLTPPFARELWDLVVRALSARQHPDYDRYPVYFRVSVAECTALLRAGLWDAQLQRLPVDIHERVGRRLGAALLADRQVQVLVQAVRAAQGSIALVFVPDERGGQHVGALPWELAFEGPQPWLLRAGHVLPCVRLFAADPPRDPLPRVPRVLLLTPNAGFQDVDRRYEREARRHLRAALGVQVVIEELGPPLTMQALDARLRDGPPLTLVDYYGHGLLRDGQGHLLFDGDAGEHDPVSAARLQVLPNVPPLWVVCACESAQQAPDEEVIANLAPALVAHPQVAAVLAMQAAHRMAAATDHVVPAVYQMLARGESFQAAAAEVRRRLYAAERDSASFYLPTLYVRQRQPAPVVVLPRAVAFAPSPSFSPSLSGNPFTPGSIVPADRFVGREDELRGVLGRLENMLSMVIVGEARIGKSSVLMYLDVRVSSLLGEHGRYQPIYLSCDGMRDQAGFCRAVLERLLPHVPPGTGQERALRAFEQRVASVDTSVTIRDVQEVITCAASVGLRVVLLLDEFKSMLDRPQVFDEPFLSCLRSLSQQRQLAMVLATRQPFTKIPGMNAYFANGLQRIDLGVLTEAAAEQLIRQPSDRPFGAAEVRLALAAGRRHPLRLQQAGFCLYQERGQASSLYYDAPAVLSRRAAALLLREVQRRYDDARAASTARLVRRGDARVSRRLGVVVVVCLLVGLMLVVVVHCVGE